MTVVSPDQSYPIAMPPILDMVLPAIDVSEYELANFGFVGSNVQRAVPLEPYASLPTVAVIR